MIRQETIAMFITFALSAILLILFFTSLTEKGVVLNNAWIMMPKSRRQHMDPKPFYRQSAIIFLLLSVMFCGLGIHFLTGMDFWRGFSIGMAIVAIGYGAVSTVILHRKAAEQCGSPISG